MLSFDNIRYGGTGLYLLLVNLLKIPSPHPEKSPCQRIAECAMRESLFGRQDFLSPKQEFLSPKPCAPRAGFARRRALRRLFHGWRMSRFLTTKLTFCARCAIFDDARQRRWYIYEHDNGNNLYNIVSCSCCFGCRVYFRTTTWTTYTTKYVVSVVLVVVFLLDDNRNNLYNVVCCLRCFGCRVFIRRQQEQLIQHCLLSPLSWLSCFY